MATKKIILDFKQQLIATKSFQYKIYINGSIITYANTLNYLDLNYKVGSNNAPFQIGIGTDLNDTINKTLSFLNSVNYVFSGSVGGYMTTVSYARVNDTIEVTIDSTATTNLICVWEMISDYDYISFQTATPCDSIFLTNQSSENAEIIFAYASGVYNVRNVELGIDRPVTIPNRFDCETYGRNYGYLFQSGGATLLTFGFTDSLSEVNINAYFSNNNLIIVINQLGFEFLGLLYSIDGVNYQPEALFAGLEIGTYTLRIKDVYGCQKTVSVINNGDTNGNITTPYVFVSESNSIRFVRIVNHQNCGNYKNVFNTLSCQENQDLKPNRFIQLFQSCDTIPTQIKTSYQNVEVFAKDNLGIETELTANKIVNNIGLSDKRDCTYYTFEGQLAVLFTAGNIYDYDTTDVIGTYELNGLLPPYGIVGTWVETTYGTVQIVNIRLADNGERSLILNINILLDNPTPGTIQTIYNKESYDIWEFNTPMNDFLNKMFTIGMRFYQTEVDELFPDVFYISEKINVKTRFPKSLEIIWYNSKNTDIYFYSGIQMKNRLNFADINTQSFDGNIENQLTDSQVISIDAVNYNGADFEVNYLTTGMIRKIVLALKHDNLIIENVPYKLTENPEVSRMGKSNFYSLKAKLLEAGDVWNQGTANTQTVFTNLELIGLLSGDSEAEYIRIN